VFKRGGQPATDGVGVDTMTALCAWGDVDFADPRSDDFVRTLPPCLRRLDRSVSANTGQSCHHDIVTTRRHINASLDHSHDYSFVRVAC